jgi:SecD/SecF fusion protein
MIMAPSSAKLRTSGTETNALLWKTGIIVLLILVSLWKLVPSIQYFNLTPAERADLDPTALEKLREGALNLGLDLQGGIHLVMQVDTSGMDGDVATDAVDKAMTVIANRVDQFGLTEPVVQRQGANRIIIELPGMSDVDRAKRLIGRTARLEFKLLKNDDDIRFNTERIDHVLSGLSTTPEEADADTTAADDLFDQAEDTTRKPFTSLLSFERAGGEPSFNILVSADNIPRVNAYLAMDEVIDVLDDSRVMLLWGPESDRDDGFRVLYLVNAASEMTGDMVADARVTIGTGLEVSPEILFDTTSDGVREWARITGANIGKRLAIVLDNTIYSAPNINDKIYGGTSRITGSFTREEARDLSIVLRAGALPASVEIIEDRTVGPSLGADSVSKSRLALMIGLASVIAFMVAYYFGSGLIAVAALILDMLFILAYLAYFHATLTLPGMAGIVLTIGMAVDANVLIFERIREELRAGNTMRVAVANGFLRARWTILDSNITTFLTAVILYNFGTGPIRGFALTLMVGIVASVITALIISRVFFDILTTRSNLAPKFMGPVSPFVNAKIPFIKHRRMGFIVSGVMILAGVVSLAIHGGPNYSIDFLGGNLVELHFDKPVDIADIRDALGKVDVEGTDFSTSEIKFIGRDKQDVLIRIVDVGNMVETSQHVKDALRENLSDAIPADQNEWLLREEQVGPSIGVELKGQAFWAIMMSLAVLILYITIRFEFKFAVGAILAIVHDVLITVGIFSLLNKEISLAIIAALLTIVGYSLNDTIVVFDRIRDKLRTGIREGYLEALNSSVNETLNRTVITSVTTLITVAALFIFGGAVIHDFSFALLIGVAVGTYSSIFVATPLLVEWYLAVSSKRGSKR